MTDFHVIIGSKRKTPAQTQGRPTKKNRPTYRATQIPCLAPVPDQLEQPVHSLLSDEGASAETCSSEADVSEDLPEDLPNHDDEPAEDMIG